LDEGRRAIALMPVEKDFVNGSLVRQYFALTAAWAGEKELALQQLEARVRGPVEGNMLSYGVLKLHPLWTRSAAIPRFEKNRRVRLRRKTIEPRITRIKRMK